MSGQTTAMPAGAWGTGALDWPATTLIAGTVRPGPPPGGDFVAGGSGGGRAGIDYVSPGYVTR